MAEHPDAAVDSADELVDPPRRHADRWVRRYRRAAIVTTAGVVFLSVAGGVVRLTGSGLGCDDWPACNDERFIDVSSTHAAIEQVNRLFSGVIGVPTLLLLVFGLLVRSRRGLRWPAVGVFTTVVANGVVGGFAVRGDLHPVLVQSHFLLAMASITFGVAAIMKAGVDPLPAPRWHDRAAQITLAIAVLTVTTLVSGTVVTGAGPHAGDETARRFGFDISNVARTHSVTVLVTLSVAVWLAWRLNREAPTGTVANALSGWLFVGVLQGVIGYSQYFNGVPELLVGVHIALAAALWVMTMRMLGLALTTPTLTVGERMDAIRDPASREFREVDVSGV
ncbi:MAG: COX15/CtaA family protein [Actinomycetota bacterium]